MNFLKDIFNVFFPEVCLCCNEHLVNNETTICLKCRHDLPLTNFSFEKNNLCWIYKKKNANHSFRFE